VGLVTVVGSVLLRALVNTYPLRYLILPLDAVPLTFGTMAL